MTRFFDGTLPKRIPGWTRLQREWTTLSGAENPWPFLAEASPDQAIFLLSRRSDQPLIGPASLTVGSLNRHPPADECPGLAEVCRPKVKLGTTDSK
jgi:hypothetical protein